MVRLLFSHYCVTGMLLLGRYCLQESRYSFNVNDHVIGYDRFVISPLLCCEQSHAIGIAGIQINAHQALTHINIDWRLCSD